RTTRRHTCHGRSNASHAGADAGDSRVGTRLQPGRAGPNCRSASTCDVKRTLLNYVMPVTNMRIEGDANGAARRTQPARIARREPEPQQPPATRGGRRLVGPAARQSV